jgi:hypothetical protein
VAWEAALIPNPWTVSLADLQKEAERVAKRYRDAAFALAVLTLVGVLGVAVFALLPWAYSEVDVKWAIARLSALVLLAALLLLASRMAWNYSNVWLGRAGTLEDLILALRLIGKRPAPTEVTTEKVSELLLSTLQTNGGAERLHVVVQSLERLRRSYEGELLKGPAAEILSGKSPSGSA